MSDAPFQPPFSLPVKCQQASVDVDGAVLLELFVPALAARKCWIWIAGGRVVVVDHKPVCHVPVPPRTTQFVLRKEIAPSGWVSCVVDKGVVMMTLDRGTADSSRVLRVEPHDGGRVVLTKAVDAGERILAVEPAHATRASDGRDLRQGKLYAPPAAAAGLTTAPSPTPTAQTAAAAPSTLIVRLRAEHKRVRRLCQAIEQDLRKHGDPRDAQQRGELLKSVLHTVKRGMSSVLAVDFESGVDVVVPLVVHKDARENLALAFQKAKRAQTARLQALPRLAAAQERLAVVEQALAKPPSDADITALLLDDGETLLCGRKTRQRLQPSGLGAPRAVGPPRRSGQKDAVAYVRRRRRCDPRRSLCRRQ
jgi:NFACT N-terminal and middle domains